MNDCSGPEYVADRQIIACSDESCSLRDSHHAFIIAQLSLLELRLVEYPSEKK